MFTGVVFYMNGNHLKIRAMLADLLMDSVAISLFYGRALGPNINR